MRCVTAVVSLFLACGCLHAQEGPDENQRVTTNVGTTISVPLNPSAQIVDIGWGLTTGIGYRVSGRQALVGEFMWNKLYPADGALQPVQVAFQKPQIAAYSNVFSLTANYRVESRGTVFTTYFIAGGGWYFRNASVRQQVPLGGGIPCAPAWIWWGYNCSAGTVTTSTARAGYAASSLGVNAGLGFTVRVGDGSHRLYIEPRYHYAPHKDINTQIIDVTIGLRY